jgi:aminopeptidase-like protein
LSILQLVEELYPFSYSVVSDGNDVAAKVFQKHLPFNVIEVDSGAAVNGWVVPNNWRVTRAEIRHRGVLVLDGTKNPLGVATLSPSFCGKISRDELQQHLVFSPSNPLSTPYHWSNLYRRGEQNWAFCVTKDFYDNLPDGDFEVNLLTEEFPSTMKILDFILPGQTGDTILLNAHNCHPWQANDDISGCAVGIAAMQELAAKARRNYTYRLLIAPELIGPVHWLEGLESESQNFVGAILLKAVGNPAPLKLQHSFDGRTQLDKAAHLAMAETFGTVDSGSFRTIYGNDETVFDSPGYEIPSITFTRMPKTPFAGYHTDADTPSRIREEELQVAKRLVLDTLMILERNLNLKFAKRGLVSLSSPELNLYKPPAHMGLAEIGSGTLEQRWHLFMNCLPRELNGSNSAIDLAYRYELPANEVIDYLEGWKSKGLANEVSRVS